MDAAFVYARPQFVSTGLANNTKQCADVLVAEGWTSVALALDEMGTSQGVDVWRPWMAEHAPRVVVFAAFTTPPAMIEELASEWPETVWVQRCHSNMAWLFTTRAFGSFLEILRVAKRRRNVRLAFVSPDESRRLRGCGLPVLTVPNVLCGDVAAEPLDGPGEGEELRLSAIFAIRGLKHPTGHFMAARLLAEGRRVRLLFQRERSDNKSWGDWLIQLGNALGLSLGVEPYRAHRQFCEWIRSTVHVGLQMSMTESFNYVTLEHLKAGVPMVTSGAIPWCPWRVGWHEDAEGVVELVRGILGDYRAASEMALEAARRIQDVNRGLFVETMRTLLEE